MKPTQLSKVAIHLIPTVRYALTFTQAGIEFEKRLAVNLTADIEIDPIFSKEIFSRQFLI